MRIQLVVLSVVVAGSACRSAPPPLGAMALTLGYQRQGVTADAAPSCAAISGLVVSDPRPNPQLIGTRFHEDVPQQVFAVTSQVPVQEWVRSAADSFLNRSLQATSAPGRGEVRVSVRRFEVTSAVAHNAVFNATVVLDSTVVMPDGRVCFMATTQGEAKNYGREDNAMNFTETLSKALERSLKELMERPGFVEATCGTCAQGGTGTGTSTTL